jgi:predicted transcriptional regulator of viral defense system
VPTHRFTELAELAAEQHGLFTLKDARAVGYEPNTIAQMARRGRLDRVSQGVYRITFLPPGPLSSYMQAALWPTGARGVLGHATALELWDVSDINPGKIHIVIPRAYRPQRSAPTAYVIHREDLAAEDVTQIEGVPVVSLDRAIRQCAADHIGPDLLEQAVRTGRARGLLTAAQAGRLVSDLRLQNVGATRG